jgi:hypothetical protein
MLTDCRRWELKMGQRGQLDRLPVAHTGPILALDWCTPSGASSSSTLSQESAITANGSSRNSIVVNWDGGRDREREREEKKEEGKESWLASGGLDRCVKVSVWTSRPLHYARHSENYDIDMACPSLWSYISQTHLQSSHVLSCSSCRLAPEFSYRANGHQQR